MGLWERALRVGAYLSRSATAVRSLRDTATLAVLSWPWVWRIRQWSGRLRLRVDVASYRTRTGVSHVGESLAVWVQLLREAALSGVAAVALLGAAEVVARLLRGRGWNGPLVDAMPSSGYELLLLTVAGFGATILGLYFTALSVVISTTYAEAPSSVRTLVAQDPAGTVFARSVAGLVVVSVTLVTAGLFDLEAAGITLVLVGAATAFSILALLRLSVRAFSFFDPVRLSPPLLRDFRKWTERAAAGGLRWRVPSFQDAYRRQAQEVLTTFQELVATTAEVERTDITDLRVLGQEVLVMWARYSAGKTSVPVDSLWFERTYEHPDWFLEAGTRLHVALAADVGLTARATAYGDPVWAERQMVIAARRCVDELLAGGHRMAVVQLAETAAELARELGRRVQIAEGELLCSAISTAWEARDESGGDDAESPIGPVQAEVLAVVDVLCLVPINLLLGFVDRCSSIDAASLARDVDAAMSRSGGPFSSGLPIEVVSELDQIRSRLDFERAVEDRQITPAWWLRHMAARHTLGVMLGALVDIVNLIDSEVVARAERLASASTFEAAAVASRALEVSHKLAVHLGAVRETFEQIATLRVVEDSFWPEPDLSTLDERARKLHRRTVDVIAKIMPILGLHERDETLPDLFGQGHAVLMREAFDAILEGDAERFEQLWPSLFASGLMAYERTRRRLSDHHDQETASIYVSELLVDLFELSGFALARSELDGGPYWATCQDLWDQFFTGQDDPEQVAQTMMAFMHLRAATFAILPRDTIRSTRQQRFRYLLAEHGLVGQDLLDFDLEIDHPSPVLRVFGRGTVGMNDAADLFVAEYLSERPGAGDPPESAESLRTDIAHERSMDGDDL